MPTLVGRSTGRDAAGLQKAQSARRAPKAARPARGPLRRSLKNGNDAAMLDTSACRISASEYPSWASLLYIQRAAPCFPYDRARDSRSRRSRREHDLRPRLRAPLLVAVLGGVISYRPHHRLRAEFRPGETPVAATPVRDNAQLAGPPGRPQRSSGNPLPRIRRRRAALAARRCRFGGAQLHPANSCRRSSSAVRRTPAGAPA